MINEHRAYRQINKQCLKLTIAYTFEIDIRLKTVWKEHK